jgi:hypothetical protein
MNPRALLGAAVDYVKRNPDEVVRAAVNAASLKFGVPLAALRWLAEQSKPSKKAPTDIEIGTSPPALRLSASVDAMGTPLRASAALRIDEVSISADTVRIGIRLNDVKLALLGESDSPVATLIKSGALDLSKPGNLVKFIPKRPAFVIEAEGDRVVVDLMRIPAIATNAKVRRALAVMSPILGIRAVETDRDHLYVALRAKPSGLPRAIEAFRSNGEAVHGGHVVVTR